MKRSARCTGRLAGLVLLLVVGSLGLAMAQGFFYIEEEKDGRIYVFASAKEYEAWKKGGELGKAITRPGAGPKGETLVFDSEDAINLYNFKHGLPGEVIIKPEEKKPVIKHSWKDGRTTFETDFATINLSNRIQVRYSLVSPEDEALETVGSFRVRRAKTKFDGWIYTRDLTFELQLNWADVTNALEDANLNYDLTRGQKQFQIKAGQFKVPFGRQELTSSGNQQFVDRSIVSADFSRGRDIGVQFWGLPFNGKLDWRVGIFNGNGRNRVVNDNSKYQFDGRVTWQPFGDVKYSECDFESTDKPLFAFAGEYEYNDARQSAPGFTKRAQYGGDFVFKFKGISVFAEYFRRRSVPEETTTFRSEAYNVQVGAFAIREKLEFALRYAVLNPDITLAEGNPALTEEGLAVNWFFNRHNLKLQSDFRLLKDETDPPDSDTVKEARLQVQFIF